MKRKTQETLWLMKALSLRSQSKISCGFRLLLSGSMRNNTDFSFIEHKWRYKFILFPQATIVGCPFSLRAHPHPIHHRGRAASWGLRRFSPWTTKPQRRYCNTMSVWWKGSREAYFTPWKFNMPWWTGNLAWGLRQVGTAETMVSDR